MARILIIDDDPVFCDMTKDILHKYSNSMYKSEYPLRIAVVGSAVKALEIIKENNFECIITDVLMAKVDGWELIRILRDKFPQFSTPIVVVSAVLAIDLEYEAIKNGASAWFHKPIRPKQFAEEVFKLVQER